MKVWDTEIPKLGEKLQGWRFWKNRGVHAALLQKLGMERMILLLSEKHVQNYVKSSPHPSATVLFQEGQFNTPVRLSGSLGTDIWKVDLKVSFYASVSEWQGYYEDDRVMSDLEYWVSKLWNEGDLFSCPRLTSCRQASVQDALGKAICG